MFKAVWMYNGVPGEDASILFADIREVQEFIVSTKRNYRARFADPKLDLGICDCSTGRITGHKRLIREQACLVTSHFRTEPGTGR
jgi:hypothetical protein